MKKALITGITGQDGSYLAELLLSKGYEVHGVIRRASTFNTSRIDHLYRDPHVNGVRLHLHYGDLADSVQMVKLLYALQPDEIYNLGAQSHVRVSFDIPEYTGDVVGLGSVRILEAIREAGLVKKCRFYQASSSEMFGKVQQVPQTEETPFWPRSPYGCAKMYAHWLTVNYRESYNLHASSGILFNHDHSLALVAERDGELPATFTAAADHSVPCPARDLPEIKLIRHGEHDDFDHRVREAGRRNKTCDLEEQVVWAIGWLAITSQVVLEHEEPQAEVRGIAPHDREPVCRHLPSHPEYATKKRCHRCAADERPFVSP